MVVGAVGLAIVLIGVAVYLVTRDDAKSDLAATTPTTATAPTTVTPDPEAVAKAEVIDAYTKSSEAFVAVASDPAGLPEDPRLKEHSTGNAHFAATASIFRMRKDGEVFTGAVEYHPTVVELGIGTATVADCSIDRTATRRNRDWKGPEPPRDRGRARDGEAAT